MSLEAISTPTFSAQDVALRRNEQEVEEQYIPTFREELLARPYMVYGSHLISALRRDVSESDNKLTSLALGATTIGSQIADRLRLGSYLTATAAIETYQDTTNIPAATAAGALTFMAFNAAVGETLNEGLEKYPRSVEAFKEAFPSVVNAFEATLPGMTQENEMDTNPEEVSRLANLKDKALLAIRRGGAGSFLGSTAFVATGATQGRTKRERRRLNFEVSRDTGLVVLTPVIAVVLKSTVWLAENGHPELAQDITDAVSSSQFWLAIGAVSMTGEYLLNKNKREASEEMETSPEGVE